MSARKIQSPGIELNEIDRSNYDKVDNSLPNSPTSMIMGFGEKGEDLVFNWIDSIDTFENTYGLPTNEYEKIFYNAAYEILNRGGSCVAAKLPYSNEMSGKYNFVEYEVSQTQNILSILQNYFLYDDSQICTIKSIKDSLYNIDNKLNIDHIIDDDTFPENLYKDSNLSIDNLKSVIVDLYNAAMTAISSDNRITNNDIKEINDFKKYISDLFNAFGEASPFIKLYWNDTNITNYSEISCIRSGMSRLDQLDNLIIRSNSVQSNHIRIYDMTHAKYDQVVNSQPFISEKLSSDGSYTKTNRCLGIVPVITTAANALFFQKLLKEFGEVSDKSIVSNYTSFNLRKNTDNVFNCVKGYHTIPNISVDINNLSEIEDFLVIPIDSTLSNSNQYDIKQYDIESVSRQASLTFPLINYDGSLHYDSTYLKYIGVVVFKAFSDTENNNNVNFQLLESFYGSLDRNATDLISHANMFIDDIVNSNSRYIQLFSNVDQHLVENASVFVASNNPATSLGFYKCQAKKIIKYKESLMQGATTILDAASNKNTMPFDLIVDAGVSNFAQLANTDETRICGIDAEKYPMIANLNTNFDFIVKNNNGWKTMLKKFDDFAKYTRKDCMFIADGFRAFCIDGNVKYVRKTAPQNTVENSILPKLSYMSQAINSSYSAGYCNWFYQRDYSDSSGQTYLWIPPSIKANGIYIYCDTYFHPWNAPAGQTRGIVPDVVDVAFIPSEDEAGKIYNNQWNYAMSYPIDGIVMEGQKTFQTQRTALDRVNVRKLLLHLEKRVARIGRMFLYEGNTEYNRQRFVDAIRPVFEDAVDGDGLLEYAIKCDEELNTLDVIENNEMRCKIAVKPVKVLEFLVLTFICTRQGANVSEEVMR